MGLLLFLKDVSRTRIFKILVRTLYPILLLFNSALPEYFLDMRQYLVRGPNNGSIYIARETLIYQCLQEEDSPGKGFLWGILYFIKRGLVILGLHSREKYLKKRVSLFFYFEKVFGPWTK